MTANSDYRGLLWLIVGLALLFYVLPWVINPGAGLTVGAYDLAEWISLSPAARNQSPVLITSFLLRLPLLSLTWLVACHAPAVPLTGRWWGFAVIVLLLALAQIPPLEFLAQTDDINHRQQALLAGLSLVAGLAGLSGRFRRFHLTITCGIAVVTAVAIIAGLVQAQAIMRQYQLPAATGVGAIGLAGVFAVLAVSVTTRLLKANRAA